MVIFHSYVSLPEGTEVVQDQASSCHHHVLPVSTSSVRELLGFRAGVMCFPIFFGGKNGGYPLVN